MTEHANNIEHKYQNFIKHVVQSEEVWGLTKNETWATSSSSEFEDTEVILFWSDKAGASACAEDEWSDYTPESVTLVEFLENWCVGMYGDELLVGADWDRDLIGKEAEPLVVALDVVTQLKATGKTLEFTQYDNQEEFEEQLIEALEAE
ncbi:DUF2750 domain-containing protein [Pontibacter anaerobius]|uniref:DUF2750 domain-containing protein n=1 Tax=Pontibacter anaerobius TaxID=2993940 RepID=A0ABT3RJ50_9BACT|nr:DUF2750 domain-containing protein [Pontibacter anaerobius]MCX2741839.1 DUF2750 domain-containing protein [Pontibacter anaerobius]